MSDARHWQDLAPRVLSGLALAVAGGLVLWLGGWVFTLAACAVCGLMIWEAGRMFDGSAPVQDGALAGAAVLVASVLPGMFALPLLAASGLVSAGRARRDKLLCFGFHVWVLLACFALILLRAHGGVALIFWLVSVVVVSDVAGYFAGRMIGGPKFWPRVSPRKTWSGTLAGWACAALAGAAFAEPTGAGPSLVPISVAVAFAGQMGDIAESAVKRRVEVKDSSDLIPGHGGVLDRFDALLGAAVAAALLWAFNVIPAGA